MTIDLSIPYHAIWLPWAALIAYGHKTIDTQWWTTKHRGPTYLFAARQWTDHTKGMARKFNSQHAAEYNEVLTIPQYEACRGKLIAQANLFDVEESDGRMDLSRNDFTCSDVSAGRFVWRFQDVKPFDKPIDMRPYRLQPLSPRY